MWMTVCMKWNMKYVEMRITRCGKNTRHTYAGQQTPTFWDNCRQRAEAERNFRDSETSLRSRWCVKLSYTFDRLCSFMCEVIHSISRLSGKNERRYAQWLISIISICFSHIFAFPCSIHFSFTHLTNFTDFLTSSFFVQFQAEAYSVTNLRNCCLCYDSTPIWRPLRMSLYLTAALYFFWKPSSEVTEKRVLNQEGSSTGPQNLVNFR